jgi:RNA polymerase sigma-70 factor (ECF subfamily)
MTESNTSHDELLTRAAAGDAEARGLLLAEQRERLRRMIAVRIDRRLLARLDPSDVVQEVLAEACLQLSAYLRSRPLPFYPWLRQLAWNRLVDLHRRHVQSQRRSVLREEGPALPDDSVLELAGRLIATGSSPSEHVLREEVRARVHAALQQLGERDREILVLRYLEKLTSGEIAAVLGLTESGVKSRHFRALQRLRGVIEGARDEDQP